MSVIYNDSKITDSAQEFSKQLFELGKYFEEGADLIIQKSAFMVFERIVERTPKLTGAAAANWQISIKDTDGASEANTNWRGNISHQRNIFFNQSVTNIIWIVNNLDYISILEEGRTQGSRGMQGSESAPQGMVGITLIEYTEYLRLSVAGMKGFEST